MSVKFSKRSAWVGAAVFVVLVLIAHQYKNSIRERLFAAIKPFAIRLLNSDELFGVLESKASSKQAASINGWVNSNISVLESSRASYSQTTEKELRRRDLEVALGVPAQRICSGGKMVKKTRLYEGNEYTLFSAEFLICTDQSQRLLLNGILALPVRASPVPLIIALHGTAAGPEVLFDVPLNTFGETITYQAEDYHNKMGSVFLAHGFAVFAPQLVTEAGYRPVSGFNQRRSELHMRLLPFGITLHGFEVSLIRNALSALLGERDINVNGEAIGAYGVSLGGATAFYLAAVDKRIKATVVSQWAENRDQKLSGSNSSANWRFLSGISVYQQGFSLKFDDAEMLKLVFPRGVFVEAGVRDHPRSVSARKELDAWRAMFPDEVSKYQLCFELAQSGHEAVLHNSVRWLEKRLVSSIVPDDFPCYSTP